MKREARDRSVIAMRLVRDRGGSEWDDVRRCYTTTSGTTLARMDKRTSSCKMSALA